MKTLYEIVPDNSTVTCNTRQLFASQELMISLERATLDIPVKGYKPIISFAVKSFVEWDKG